MKAAGSLEALREQAPLLSAAEALEKRAEAIQTWPFDDRTLRLIAAIVTSVVVAAITRLVLKPLGL